MEEPIEERYPGRLATLVPAAILAFPLALAAVVGLLMAMATGRLSVPGFNERIAILLGSIFFGLCAFSLLKVGLSGFYREVALTRKAILLRQFGRCRTIEWTELKRTVCEPTMLCLVLRTGEHIDLHPSVSGFEKLQQSVNARILENQKNSGPPDHSVASWTDG
ncbi:MAG: hypothetical protein HY319_08610 [Armatimonadetes bacterium]|nr:hypothetical protein [Armatimonadota bacterium]